MTVRQFQYGVLPTHEEIADKILAKHPELAGQRARFLVRWSGVDQRLYSFADRDAVTKFVVLLKESLELEEVRP